MQTNDLEYVDNEIKELCEKIQKKVWLRLRQACAGHSVGVSNPDRVNLLFIGLDVLDHDRFERLKGIVSKEFPDVIWGLAIANDRIQYKFDTPQERDRLVKCLIEALDSIE